MSLDIQAKKDVMKNILVEQIETREDMTTAQELLQLGEQLMGSKEDVYAYLLEDHYQKLETSSQEQGLLDAAFDHIGDQIKHGVVDTLINSMAEKMGKDNYLIAFALLKQAADQAANQVIDMSEGELKAELNKIQPSIVTEPISTTSSDSTTLEHTPHQSDAAQVFESLLGEKPSRESFYPAYSGRQKLVAQGAVGNTRYLGIVDFSQANTEERFVVIDMDTNQAVYNVQAGHGKGSGNGAYANTFSNTSGSNQSSLGFVKTAAHLEWNTKKTWQGLRLTGLEAGVNDQTDERGIFLHAGSVSGSEGCITLPKDADSILQKMGGGALIFGYHPTDQYYTSSDVLDASHDLA